MDADENKTICMYDNKVMTVAEYKQRRGVAEFERKLRTLAFQSALCQVDKTDVTTGEQYSIFNEGFPTHENRRCLYFEKYVLPSDPKLEADYWSVFQGGKVSGGIMKGDCNRCSQQFIKRAGNQIYCESCQVYRERERKRAAYHRAKQKG